MQNPPKPAGGAILGPERHLNGGLLPATGWFPISTNDSTTEYPQVVHQGQRTPPNILLFLPLVTPKITHSKLSLQKKTKEVDSTRHITTFTPQPGITRHSVLAYTQAPHKLNVETTALDKASVVGHEVPQRRISHGCHGWLLP